MRQIQPSISTTIFLCIPVVPGGGLAMNAARWIGDGRLISGLRSASTVRQANMQAGRKRRRRDGRCSQSPPLAANLVEMLTLGDAVAAREAVRLFALSERVPLLGPPSCCS
ncbi:hypothetical protein CC78DRAFT_93898 [Lojkania enalia]|uniref:Uncharacterized protein n=1 Tax=Lojkania enalia TaxID=147567 RepID=A0A9P4KGH2_9PLEO|nr:hypothetical protein CC78DRAFT_93898 [Didymosphaeria enalia]